MASPAWARARPAVLLLGDSITQEGTTAEGGWAALLAGHYSRRADVVNRGLSGYNSRWALDGLDSLWAPHGETALATIWYGANDAADAALNPRQHVPVAEYKANLAELVARVKRRCASVVVVSPPPIHEASYRTVFIEPRAGKGAPLDRTLEVSGRYATAAGEVAAASGCAFVDLWTKVQQAAPATGAEQPWGRFFYDGLHLSREGNKLAFDELLSVLGRRFPNLLVEPCPNTGKLDNSSSSSTALLPHLPWHDWITIENQSTVLKGGVKRRREEEAAARQAPAGESPESAVRRLAEVLGEAPKVCILGGTTFNDPSSESLVASLAQEMSARLGDRVTLVTGGMDGVQKAFAGGCKEGVRLFNVLPAGQSSGYGRGEDVSAGQDLKGRIAVFGLLGDVYVTIEGGPGVAGEARAAAERGASVVPLLRTGGASGGMFDFPQQAMARPAYATEEQWRLLGNKGASVAESASAAAAIVAAAVESRKPGTLRGLAKM